ncbi:hypothetical protein ACCO45_009927 [Purpureocillium lilacinum]|uniref:Uncharacterized protein n=1 Tax=Purpureocillium lilacinum TaxID=33203 RepID=A0ACC4DDI9_PURLI
MSASQACDLLEVYFCSESATGSNPLSFQILGSVFRRSAFTSPLPPNRRRQPVLLASILMVGCRTTQAVSVLGSEAQCTMLYHKLLDLTTSLLSINVQQRDLEILQKASALSPIHGYANNPITPSCQNQFHDERALLDVISTYIHLGTALSASESRLASMKWWTAAMTLARELRLFEELPLPQRGRQILDEEHREERRRIWWLLYAADRHTALSYNRPIFLRDAECGQLLLPMAERSWQDGSFDPGSNERSRQDMAASCRLGPRIAMRLMCTDTSLFGCFLPLMFILGEIVNEHQYNAQSHGGRGADDGSVRGRRTAEIRDHLAIYHASLQSLELGIQDSRGTLPASATLAIHDRLALLYGTCVMHVLHVLLADKWDPIELLEDCGEWIASEMFVDTANHAVLAAEAVDQILKLDPALKFMPFFFGVYLLQSSFHILLFADRLHSDMLPELHRSCEIVARAHEACTLVFDTDYQRCFGRAIRSALASARGEGLAGEPDEDKHRRQLFSRLQRRGGTSTISGASTFHHKVGNGSVPQRYESDRGDAATIDRVLSMMDILVQHFRTSLENYESDEWVRPAVQAVKQLWCDFKAQDYSSLPVSRNNAVCSRAGRLEAFDLISERLRNFLRPQSRDEYKACTSEPAILIEVPALQWWLDCQQHKRWPKLSQLAVNNFADSSN